MNFHATLVCIELPGTLICANALISIKVFDDTLNSSLFTRILSPISADRDVTQICPTDELSVSNSDCHATLSFNLSYPDAFQCTPPLLVLKEGRSPVDASIANR